MSTQTHSVDPTHVTVDPSPVRLRVELGGQVVAESARTLVVREKGLPPRYYVPPGDVRMDFLEHTKEGGHCPYKGDWHHLNMRVGERVVMNAAWAYQHTFVDGPQIKDHVSFYPDKVDVFRVS
jgi:uncharacterized protein (DUF427 family)